MAFSRDDASTSGSVSSSSVRISRFCTGRLVIATSSRPSIKPVISASVRSS
jgi:hypothetical protein